MEQHVLRGRGAPDKVPTAFCQHYIDMNTDEQYISNGTSTLEDWGTPLIEKKVLETRLLQFAAESGGGIGQGTILEVAVQDINLVGQRAVIDPSLSAGKMAHITDLTDLNKDYLIDLTASKAMGLGLELRVFNDTDVFAQILGTTDLVKYALAGASAKIRPLGVATIKLLSVTAGKNTWLVYGDLVGA